MSMLREEIRQVVKASVVETLQQIGFTMDDPHAIQKDMIHLRMVRIGQEEMTKWVKRTAVGVLVTALLYLLWDAIAHMIIMKR